jgi:hypothetical protein
MRFALVGYFCLLGAVGCGGSSSETPPPLQPDPTSARYTGPRFPAADDSPPPAVAGDDDYATDLPRKPARATWGSGHAPATASSVPPMSSPNAVKPAEPSGGPTPK